MKHWSITETTLKNKKVIIRADFNVPIEDKKIYSYARINSSLNTINYAIKKNAYVIIMSHLGRPKEKSKENTLSLKPIAEVLSKKLKAKIRLIKEYLKKKKITIKKKQIILCENVRFNKGEKKSSKSLSKKIARMCDIFIMDAFASCHRKESSTYGIIKYAPICCSGLLLNKELTSLTKAINKNSKPITAIIGGKKISTKLPILKSLIQIADSLILGGGIANTFLKAIGYNVGNSVIEKSLITTAQNLLNEAEKKGVNIPLPIDVNVANEFNKNAKSTKKMITSIDSNDMILDIGPITTLNLKKIIIISKTIIWNGPVGVFEFENFQKGTKSIAKAIAKSKSFSIAGGGDTIAAIEKFDIKNDISYISTGGGAFLKFIENKKLESVEQLKKRKFKAK